MRRGCREIRRPGHDCGEGLHHGVAGKQRLAGGHRCPPVRPRPVVPSWTRASRELRLGRTFRRASHQSEVCLAEAPKGRRRTQLLQTPPNVQWRNIFVHCTPSRARAQNRGHCRWRESCQWALDMRGIEARFVYILRSDSDPSRHCAGRTADVDNRVEWHNHGPCGYTLEHRPWSVIVSLEFPTE